MPLKIHVDIIPMHKLVATNNCICDFKQTIDMPGTCIGLHMYICMCRHDIISRMYMNFIFFDVLVIFNYFFFLTFIKIFKS